MSYISRRKARVDAIARYRTRQGAERYMRELQARWPDYKFFVAQHPRDFGFTVATVGAWEKVTYCEKRPRGGFKPIVSTA